LPIDFEYVDKITIYDDLTYVDKQKRSFHNAFQHVTGVSFGIGDVYAYLDVASGLNHPWLNDTYGVGFGEGQSDPRWNTRFNLNVGYYF
jgi:hypothetical protein